MKSKKIISDKNLGMKLSAKDVVVFWFLWEHLPFEWFRALLVAAYIVIVLTVIIMAVNSEPVDIFENK